MLCGVAVLALGCLAATAHVLHGLGGGGGWMPAAACADPPANSSLHGVCAAASDAQVRSWSAAAGASACSSALAVAASLYAVCTWRQAPRALFAVGATALSLLLLSPTAVATYTGHTVDGHLVFGGLKAGAAAFYLVRGGSAASCRWCGGGAAVWRCASCVWWRRAQALGGVSACARMCGERRGGRGGVGAGSRGPSHPRLCPHLATGRRLLPPLRPRLPWFTQPKPRPPPHTPHLPTPMPRPGERFQGRGGLGQAAERPRQQRAGFVRVRDAAALLEQCLPGPGAAAAEPRPRRRF